MSWKLDYRPLRTKLIESNPPDDELSFMLKQIVSGTEEGVALLAEHDDRPAALLLAQEDQAAGALRILDLRVDSDFRRQGLGTALLCMMVQEARQRQLRAVVVETRTNNIPVNLLLQKCGFSLAGVDTHRHSNHDVVKECATLFWYSALD